MQNRKIICEYFECDNPATVRIIRANTCVCDEHLELNIVRFGINLSIEPINDKED